MSRLELCAYGGVKGFIKEYNKYGILMKITLLNLLKLMKFK